MIDPNKIDVEDDTQKSVVINDTSINDPAPIIPTLEELRETPNVQESFILLGGEVDSDAPYGRNKDGTPAKKRGRKAPADAQTAPESQSDQFGRLDSVTPTTARPTVNKVVTGAPIVFNYRQLGETAANFWFNIPQIIFGEDWAPEEKEIKPVAKAFQDYFEAKEINNIDPTFGLIIALGAYTINKVNKPTVKTKMQSMVNWVKGKVWKR